MIAGDVMPRKAALDLLNLVYLSGRIHMSVASHEMRFGFPLLISCLESLRAMDVPVNYSSGVLSIPVEYKAHARRVLEKYWESQVSNG